MHAQFCTGKQGSAIQGYETRSRNLWGTFIDRHPRSRSCVVCGSVQTCNTPTYTTLTDSLAGALPVKITKLSTTKLLHMAQTRNRMDCFSPLKAVVSQCCVRWAIASLDAAWHTFSVQKSCMGGPFHECSTLRSPTCKWRKKSVRSLALRLRCLA